MENGKLTGTLVLVHPDFKNDPVQMQGQVAVMTYLKELNEMYVRFPDGKEGIYSWDTLFKLKDKQEIFDDLMANGSSMEQNDFKAMYKIMLLQDRGTSRGTFDALVIARDNPGIWNRALDNVRQTERIGQEKIYAR